MQLVIYTLKQIHRSKGKVMNREPWVAYLVVIGVVAAMMYGKYLMAGGGDNNNSTTEDEEKK
jgi:quinol-cytochrome oxidoreductase complex cytochrome b subunit